MIEPLWFLTGAAAPALLVAGVLYGMTHPRIAGKWLSRNAAWSLAIGIGFVLSFLVTEGAPPIPPRESPQWLIVAVVPLAFIANLVGWWGCVGRGVGGAILAVLLAGWAPLLLQSYLKYTWSTREAVVWLIGLAVLGAFEFALVGGLASRGRARFVVFALGLIAAVTGVLVMLSGSATLGQLGLGLGCALLGGWVVVLLRPIANLSTGLAVVVLLWLGICANGYFYATLTPLRVVCLAASPLGLWVAELPAIKKRSTGVQVVSATVVVVIPLLIAAADAAVAFAAEMNKPATPY